VIPWPELPRPSASRRTLTLALRIGLSSENRDNRVSSVTSDLLAPRISRLIRPLLPRLSQVNDWRSFAAKPAKKKKKSNVLG
jgi:hypothetical protein